MAIETMKTLEELLNYVEEHIDVIYVRDYKDREMGNWSLSELTSEQAIKHIFSWIRNYTKETL